MERGKGISHYHQYPLIFEPIYEERFHYPFEEIFKDITDISVPMIAPWYMISNFGRIWHKYLNEFLNINIDSKGYSYKPFTTRESNLKTSIARIHRVVMMEFNYIPGCENLQVNHIDGNKMNNLITNLEWCTASENMLHCARILGKKNMPKSDYYTVNLVNNICQDLVEKILSEKEIAQKYNVPTHYVESISARRISKEICDKYDFGNRKNRLTDDQVKEICNYYVNNPHNGFDRNFYAEIINKMGFDNKNINDAEMFRNIYNKKTYKSIVKDYDW